MRMAVHDGSPRIGWHISGAMDEEKRVAACSKQMVLAGRSEDGAVGERLEAGIVVALNEVLAPGQLRQATQIRTNVAQVPYLILSRYQIGPALGDPVVKLWPC